MEDNHWSTIKEYQMIHKNERHSNLLVSSTLSFLQGVQPSCLACHCNRSEVVILETKATTVYHARVTMVSCCQSLIE